jgi:hypothetical protein
MLREPGTYCITNFSDLSYQSDISEGLDKVEDLIAAWLQTLPSVGLLIDYRAGVDDADVPAAEMAVNGVSIWSEHGPVHPAPQLYSRLVAKISLALCEYDLHSEGGPSKRARLESMVVCMQASDQAAPVRPQSWSAGVLPELPKRGKSGKRGSQRGGHRGTFPGRGYWLRGGGNSVRGGLFRRG